MGQTGLRITLMKINLLSLFTKKKIQSDFPIGQFNALPKEEGGYPLFLPMEKSDVHAHSAQFMIKPEDLSVIEHIIELFFHGTLRINEEKGRVAYHNKTLVCYKFKEFGQSIVKIITNDNEFVKYLCDKGLEPPGPESVFPDKDFGNYGSLQGDIAFWWDVYWEPFWKSLNESERKEYLGRSNFSDDTVEFLELHN